MAVLVIRAILEGLSSAGVRFVLTGSVAAKAYGAPVEPRDLDIAPDLSAENLELLAGLLSAWRATPHFDPAWEDGMTADERAAWTPDPPTPGHLDHLFETDLGLFDVVPWRSGWYLDLVARAQELRADGLTIAVAHVDDLIATMRPDKPKHATRLQYLEGARVAARLAPPW